MDSLQNPKAVLLDRDGVINEDSEHYIKSAEEWRPINGSLQAIARLNQAGIPLAICTNQAGIARGVFAPPALGEIHAALFSAAAAEGASVPLIRYCPHGPDAGCACRKPQPAMLITACRYLGVDPTDAWFVGDSLKDLQAAEAAGCQAVLVRTGNGASTETRLDGLQRQPLVFDSLSEAVSSLDV